MLPRRVYLPYVANGCHPCSSIRQPRILHRISLCCRVHFSVHGLVNFVFFTTSRKGIISWNWLWPKRKHTTTNESSLHPASMSYPTVVTNSPDPTTQNFTYPP